MLTYGLFNSSGNILLGPAVDEVASWHEAANWIGVLHTPTAYLSTKDVRESKGILVDYTVPLKKEQ